MPRRPRVVAPGEPHHMTQRGNNRQPVFHSDADRQFYIELLAHYAAARQVRILGYCLMTNHIHLVTIPDRPDALARALKGAHSEYAANWNRAEKRSGHLWQGRFVSCPLDQTHLLSAPWYVDQNSVRTRRVDTATGWPWSSARPHTDPAIHDELLDSCGRVPKRAGRKYKRLRAVRAHSRFADLK